jgi:hypothetical protein
LILHSLLHSPPEIRELHIPAGRMKQQVRRPAGGGPQDTRVATLREGILQDDAHNGTRNRGASGKANLRVQEVAQQQCRKTRIHARFEKCITRRTPNATRSLATG